MATHVDSFAPRLPLDLPRRALQADGVLSTAFGAVTIAGSESIARFLGLEGSPTKLALLGAVCLAYGIGLGWTAARTTIARGTVITIGGLNVAWVLASALILLAGQPALTAGGRWTVAILAVVAADLAVFQFFAARRMR